MRLLGLLAATCLVVACVAGAALGVLVFAVGAFGH
jgi:hypothetical protein